jgi:hypothetical protein
MGRHVRSCHGALLLVFGLCSGAVAQEPGQRAVCRDTVFSGRVIAGQDHEASLTPDLVFRLVAEAHPSNPAGWTIRITPPSAPDSDYSMVATPPYRFFNPRYVNTSYGVTAEAALALTPRRFQFVASPENYEAAVEAVDILLWPGALAPERVDLARETLSQIPTYPGTLSIEDGAAVAADSLHPLGLIEWMAFRVNLCLPTPLGTLRRPERSTR